MSDYTNFREQLANCYPAINLDRLSLKDELSMREKFPNIPEHYLEFLKEVGVGNIGDDFAIYSEPVKPEEIFDNEIVDAKLKKYLFIGDDLWGGMVGFDTSATPWELVIFDHDNSFPNHQNSPRTYLRFLEGYLFTHIAGITNHSSGTPNGAP
jgi:hypothetical protein